MNKSQHTQDSNFREPRDLYDFSGPLWKKYHKETRSKAKFPRGYKEVRLLG